MGKKKNKDSEKQEQEQEQKQESTENKIDFYKGFSPDSDKNIPFPAPNTSEPRVYIEEETYKEIQSHAQETTSVEICGVLIGEVRFDVSGNYLYVCGSIRGEKAKNSGANVSFTPETWDYIHKTREEKYSNYSIIGWYHTHPGFGIFLSDMDKFIQDYFFNMPYQVAMVIDPKAEQKGIFAWQDGKIRPLQQCWVGKEQSSLVIGTVGGEETFRGKESASIVTINEKTNTSKEKESEDDEESDNSFYKHAFYYFLCFNLAFLLANLLNMKFVTDKAITAAQTEAKDIIQTWSINQAFSNELDELANNITQTTNNLQASATYDANTIKQFAQSICIHLSYLSNNAKMQSRSATEILRKIGNRNITVQQKEELKVEAMKHMVAGTILLQIEPYLKSLTAQPLSPTDERVKEAKKILDYVIELCPPEQQTALKQTYNWIYQGN